MPAKVTIMGKEAKVKIVNAAKNKGDFFFDNNKINGQSLSFGQSNDVKVASGNTSISFYANGVQDVSTTINFVSSFSYTAFYVEDKAGKGDILAFEDNLGATEAGKARVRFMNLSPSFTNSININLPGSTLLVNALGFKETSLDFSIEPNVNLGISVLGAGGVKVIDGSEFEAGKIYTIWISGTSNANLTVNKITYN
ncbi:hypothetical protein AQF98_01685 [Pedobacter sp. Hv1]|nr:hypothetical protein AQF98_01685 [Pedobacter sp. Hv1]